jgi:hypothetical protein
MFGFISSFRFGFIQVGFGIIILAFMEFLKFKREKIKELCILFNVRYSNTAI